MGFNSKISNFFSSYLINRQTWYVWNYFIFPFFKANISMIRDPHFLLFFLYFTLLPFFIYSKKDLKNLLFPIIISILAFVDNGLFISQEKSYDKSNANLFYSYSIISSLFKQFSLVIKHDKSEVFHFSRSTENINPPPLDLGPLKELVLWSKDT